MDCDENTESAEDTQFLTAFSCMNTNERDGEHIFLNHISNDLAENSVETLFNIFDCFRFGYSISIDCQ